MTKLKTFMITAILGGLAVILPTVLLILIFRWLFNWITNIIQPLTNLVIERAQLQEIVADVVVIVIILAGCFIIGLTVKTKVGQFIQENLEKRILKLAPGYPTIKSVVMQFIGQKTSAFSSVALVQPFENDTLLTAFITETHNDGLFTVFVPTGPNPTTGFIFHLQQQYVHPVNVSVEETLRSVISCGAGSVNLINAYTDRRKRSKQKL